MNTLQVGDVVHLNSGGPNMTVTTVWSDGSVDCGWIPDRSTYSEKPTQAQLFNPACLTLVKRPTPREPSPLEQAAEEYRLASDRRRACRDEGNRLGEQLKAANKAETEASEAIWRAEAKMERIASGEQERSAAATAQAEVELKPPRSFPAEG